MADATFSWLSDKQRARLFIVGHCNYVHDEIKWRRECEGYQEWLVGRTDYSSTAALLTRPQSVLDNWLLTGQSTFSRRGKQLHIKEQ